MYVANLFANTCISVIVFIAIVSYSLEIQEPKYDEITSYEIAKEKLKEIFSKEIRLQKSRPSVEGISPDYEISTIRKFLVQPPADQRSLITSLTKLSSDSQDSLKYINEWLVHLKGGEVAAESIVKALGYEFKGSITGFDDIYAVSHRLEHHNHKRESKALTKNIDSQIEVLWAEQQIARRRVKRKISSEQIKEKSSEYPQLGTKKDVNELIVAAKEKENFFNDKLWKHQWYLYDSRIMEGLPEIDLKVIPVWKSGITGKGVKILIVDDGLEWKHKDLIDSYDAAISYDFNDDDVDPSPRMDEGLTNSHGTRCAGEISMQPNNTRCGVGIAYGSKIGGIRALDGDITDKIEALSLARGIDHAVDIVSCSWGPVDDGRSVEGPGRLAKEALRRGVTKGRSGKGIIYVWAAGNGGANNDNCNCDGYASSIYTISIGSASESGFAPWYGEHCASIMTSTYSSGAYSDQKIVTTDLKDECTIDFSGTSAATPLGAGIVALALEANPSLTWRDIQHAIILTSEWRQLSRDKGWRKNGKGLFVNNKFGFGLMNAEALVKAVKNWTAVPDSAACKINANLSGLNLISSGNFLEIGVLVNCPPPFSLLSLEHVEMTISLDHSRRGCLRITIISPLGTETEILAPRKYDDSSDGFRNWTLTSVHTWGEDPSGNWKVLIEDTSAANEVGFIESLSLLLHGTSSVPDVFNSFM